MEHKRHASLASGINIILGLWMIASPFIFSYSGLTFDLWNSVIAGAAITLISIYRSSAADRGEGWSWLNFLIGLWLIISPFISFYANNTLRIDTFVIGIAVAILAAYSASETHRLAEERTKS